MLDAVDKLDEAQLNVNGFVADQVVGKLKTAMNFVVDAKALWTRLAAEHEAGRQKALGLNPFRDLPMAESEVKRIGLHDANCDVHCGGSCSCVF